MFEDDLAKMYLHEKSSMYYHELLSQLCFKFEEVDVADGSVSISVILENSVTKFFLAIFKL